VLLDREYLSSHNMVMMVDCEMVVMVDCEMVMMVDCEMR